VKSILLFVAIVVFGLLAPVVARVLLRRRDHQADWPFTFRKPLSRVEQVLYFRLAQTLPEFVVLAQVPLSSFLRVRRGRTWNEWYNRISQKSVDFLICERDFSVVMAVELDDGTHDAPDRARSDKTKSRALTAAGVRLVRWRANALPDVETIRRMVDGLRGQGAHQVPTVAAPLEAPLHVSRIEASNDPSIFHAETRS
jgi:hypothetical protein